MGEYPLRIEFAPAKGLAGHFFPVSHEAQILFI